VVENDVIMQLIHMLGDTDVLHDNTIYCSVSQRCQLVAGEELQRHNHPRKLLSMSFRFCELLSVSPMRHINART